MTDELGCMRKRIGIYIHIPFCKKKCSYCDFLSFLLPCEDRVADYVLGVKRELALLAAREKNAEAVSLYIGGGTPSLLSPEYLGDIFSAVKENFPLSPNAEISLEANPGTLSRYKLQEMVSIGVNRLSIGMQSMEDKLLRSMGRLHTAKEAEEAFYLARQEGIANINIDLMHALPGQTVDDWRHTLHSIIKLDPEHISAYGLTLERNTVWGELYSQGAFELPEEDECAQMYNLSREMLSEAGFLHYEISNYAKPGYECRHNLSYWYRKPYIGVGLGASSFISGVRYKNHTQLETYLQLLKEGKLPIVEEEQISREQAMSETMFLNLRTASGVNTLEFTQQFNASINEVFYPVIGSLEKTGVLIREGDWIRLNPNYFAVGNEVFLKFV